MTATELAERRKALGLSQYALAKRLGTSNTTVMRWETPEGTYDAAGNPRWREIPAYLDLALWAIEHGAPARAPPAG